MMAQCFNDDFVSQGSWDRKKKLKNQLITVKTNSGKNRWLSQISRKKNKNFREKRLAMWNYCVHFCSRSSEFPKSPWNSGVLRVKTLGYQNFSKTIPTKLRYLKKKESMWLSGIFMENIVYQEFPRKRLSYGKFRTETGCEVFFWGRTAEIVRFCYLSFLPYSAGFTWPEPTTFFEGWIRTCHKQS